MPAVSITSGSFFSRSRSSSDASCASFRSADTDLTRASFESTDTDATYVSLESADIATTLKKYFEDSFSETLGVPQAKEERRNQEKFLHLDEAIEAQALPIIEQKNQYRHLPRSASFSSPATNLVKERPPLLRSISFTARTPKKSRSFADFLSKPAQSLKKIFSSSLSSISEKNDGNSLDIKGYLEQQKLSKQQLVSAEKELKKAEEQIEILQSNTEKFKEGVEQAIRDISEKIRKHRADLAEKRTDYSKLEASLDKLRENLASEKKKFKSFGFFNILNILGVSKFFRNEKEILSLQKKIKNSIVKISHAERKFQRWIDNYYAGKELSINEFKKDFNLLVLSFTGKGYALVEYEKENESNPLFVEKLKNNEIWSKWISREEESLSEFIKDYETWEASEINAKSEFSLAIFQLKEKQEKVREMKEKLNQIAMPNLGATFIEKSDSSAELPALLAQAYV